MKLIVKIRTGMNCLRMGCRGDGYPVWTGFELFSTNNLFRVDSFSSSRFYRITHILTVYYEEIVGTADLMSITVFHK